MADTHAHPAPAPLGGKLITPTTIILGVLTLIGFGILIYRFIYGIGAVANVNDGYPWGIWVAYDVVVGSALACGGFAMALLVYIFNKGEYHPLVRPALLASLFGYTLAGLSVIIDLGRYWNFWHIFWPKYAQVNSVMFEVALCVSAYILVMWIEFTPAVLEKFGLRDLRRKLNKVLFFFIGLGVLLPTMHQSSLGSLLVVFGEQINPLWQTIFLPLLFLISALSMGFAMVIFEASLSSVGFRRPMETDILAKVARVLVFGLSLYLVLRIGDLIWRGALPLAFNQGFKSFMFWVELALFVVPVVLLRNRAGRYSPKALFISAVAMVLAGFIYRINAYLIGYETGPGWTYFPSFPELMMTIGLIAFEILAYILFVRFLPILPADESATQAPAAAAAR
jgi:Ni/Fe-hydrogenase subunit HybB-like protein